MPENDNPIRRALQDQLGDRYSQVMEGIGRVAVAMSHAEFFIDVVGCRLTGNWHAYFALTNRMALSVKVARVAEMSEGVLLNPEIMERVKRFCKEVGRLIEHRNTAVHSLYYEHESGIYRFKFTTRRNTTHGNVTPDELLELEDKILSLTAANKSLDDEVASAMESQADAARMFAATTRSE